MSIWTLEHSWMSLHQENMLESGINKKLPSSSIDPLGDSIIFKFHPRKEGRERDKGISLLVT